MGKSLGSQWDCVLDIVTHQVQRNWQCRCKSVTGWQQVGRVRLEKAPEPVLIEIQFEY